MQLRDLCSINSILLADKVLWIWPSSKKAKSVVGGAETRAADQSTALYADLEKRLRTTLGRSWHRKMNPNPDIDASEVESIEFEFLVLEAILEEATQIYNITLEALQENVNQALGNKNTQPQVDLNHLRIVKQRVNELEANLRSLEEAMEEILNDNDRLQLMNITELHKDPISFQKHLQCGTLPLENATLVMDHYVQECEDLVNRIELLQKEIEASEKLMELQLDTTRNKLLKADLCFSVINISVGTGAMISSILGKPPSVWANSTVCLSIVPKLFICARVGMNLHNGKEEASEWWFIGTSLAIVFGVLFVGCCLGLIVMYQVGSGHDVHESVLYCSSTDRWTCDWHCRRGY
mmetsp:Transcript_12596/g.45976  ORF Transcript_12596/g.45976 Transcript_12596/m.45976 type:complete len:352 (-) Transcript_12596:950-2005(-)